MAARSICPQGFEGRFVAVYLCVGLKIQVSFDNFTERIRNEKSFYDHGFDDFIDFGSGLF